MSNVAFFKQFLAVFVLVVCPSVSAQEIESGQSQVLQPMVSGLVEDSVRAPIESPLDAGVDLVYVPVVSYPNHNWGVLGFKTNQLGQGFRLGFEWLPLPEEYGKVGVGIQAGFDTIRKVLAASNDSSSIYVFPVTATLSYRFDYVRNQILVPFLKAGIGGAYLNQTGAGNRALTSFGWERAIGLQICLNGVDPVSAAQFDKSMGVNRTYLLIEGVRQSALTSRVQTDLGHDEIRVGLRFEM